MNSENHDSTNHGSTIYIKLWKCLQKILKTLIYLLYYAFVLLDQKLHRKKTNTGEIQINTKLAKYKN